MVDVISHGVWRIVEANDFFDNQKQVFHQKHPIFLLILTVNDQPLIQAITSHAAEIIFFKIEEHSVDQLFGIFFGGQIPWTNSFVNFFVTLALIFGDVFGQCFIDKMHFAIVGAIKSFQNFFIFLHAKSPQQRSHGNFSLAVNANIQNASQISVNFNPSSTIWNQLCAKKFLAFLIFHCEEHS